jgi:hypothetical protein
VNGRESRIEILPPEVLEAIGRQLGIAHCEAGTKRPRHHGEGDGAWGCATPGKDGATQAWHARRRSSRYFLAIAANMSSNIP